MKASYYDISGILSAKADRRQALAALSWEEKVAIVKRMRELLPKGQWEGGVADKKSAQRRAKT